MKVVSSAQMRELDELTIKSRQVDGKELMLRAGVGFAEAAMLFINTFCSKHFKRVVVLAGKGNNAGDAYVSANYFYEKFNLNIIVFAICGIDKLSGDTKYYAQRMNSSVNFAVKETLNNSDFFEGDVIIDGLLGTGFEGEELKGLYKNWIEVVNRQNKVVIAIDVPSGLNATNGIGTGIKADLTITIALPKRGFFIKNGVDNTGKIKVVDIGISSEFIDKIESDLNLYSKDLASKFLRRIPCNIHKKLKGSVLIIGGSKYYTGAPFLSGLAALRSGAGLVTVAIPKTVKVNCNCNSLIIRRVEDANKGIFCSSSMPEIISLIEQHSSIVIGPGMASDTANIEILKTVIESGKRVVFDADALNLIALNPNILKKYDNFVFTPHHGEALRLAKAFGVDVGDDRITFAKELAEVLGGTLVCKGNKTITSSYGKTSYANGSGSAALATAGSGDVLSGIIGALISNSINDVFEPSVFAVYLHGCAGELAEIDYGVRGTTADDIINYIPKAMKEISPFA
ncbi:MAG: NAD(P)H-hydrate dehydratase [Lentisphaerota bacterium]